VVCGLVQLVAESTGRAQLKTMPPPSFSGPKAPTQGQPEEELHLGRDVRTPEFLGARQGRPAREVCPVRRANGVLTICHPTPDEAIRFQRSKLDVRKRAQRWAYSRSTAALRAPVMSRTQHLLHSASLIILPRRRRPTALKRLGAILEMAPLGSHASIQKNVDVPSPTST
jgi:hypothetical protein